MSTSNAYLDYKRDTQQLVRWLVMQSNAIIQASPTGTAIMAINTTGQLRISDFVPVSKLISQNTAIVPPNVYQLFRGVIRARVAHHNMFSGMTAQDAAAKTSNDSHAHFINVLQEAFECLGGTDWLAKSAQRRARPQPRSHTYHHRQLANMTVNNVFSTLDLVEGQERSSDKVYVHERRDSVATESSTSKPARKSKKGKLVNTNKSGPSKPLADEQPPGIPLDSYRILDDSGESSSDYGMAVFSLFTEWAMLRTSIHRNWLGVANSGINAACAAATSNLVIAMMTRIESAIGIDFPGQDCFEKVLNAHMLMQTKKLETQGMSYNMPGMFPGSTDWDGPDFVRMHLEEASSLHAYRDLVEFIRDYQQNQNGKPTKRLTTELNTWEVDGILPIYSNDWCINWRRLYTINWLYDLVNNFVADPGLVTSASDRTLYAVPGVDAFARDITTFVLQKPGIGSPKILPRHVFQLQLIVDSFMVSRGWTFHHRLDCSYGCQWPLPSSSPRRDLDLFLYSNGNGDKEKFLNSGLTEKERVGILAALDQLEFTLNLRTKAYGATTGQDYLRQVAKSLREDFANRLGRSVFVRGTNTRFTSRFSKTNSNGLWDYSPYLCGNGLLEGLEISSRLGLQLLNAFPEPLMLIHLHNKLVQERRCDWIVRPMFKVLTQIFPSSFWSEDAEPTANFEHALLVQMRNNSVSYTNNPGQRFPEPHEDVRSKLSSQSNRVFAAKSLLTSYHEAEWSSDRIPDASIHPQTWLGRLRAYEAESSHSDAADVEDNVIEADLGNRFIREFGTAVGQFRGSPEHVLAQMEGNKHRDDLPFHMQYSFDYEPEDPTRLTAKKHCSVDNYLFLAALSWDLHGDICGDVIPYSGINYTMMLCRMLQLGNEIERRLAIVKPDLLPAAAQLSRSRRADAKTTLTKLLLSTDDETCSVAVQEAFECFLMDLPSNCYWAEWGRGPKN
ncbi:hypothetical protein C1H76_1600 [Elsinoe australis]|uniref:DUF6604 domain-containing protein n=1 Tax=Elsinoe australis TaxID=40998 RepID=A0A4U7BE10_9PEZI|nr:hypothetical protein C1H76_1600 [Elsinoe australis]